jgi:hypothetical protein
MGLLAQKRVLFVLIFFGMAACVQAEDDLFHLTMVDYFGVKARKKESLEPGYQPPQVVTDLLNDPSEQTALAYLRWHRERLEKISRAQQVLDKLIR